MNWVSGGGVDRALGGTRIFDLLERGIDLSHVERQPPQRAITFERHPVLRRLRLRVDLVTRAGRRTGRLEPAKAQRARHLEPGAHDGIIDHHDRDGGPGDDVEIVAGATRFGLGHEIEPHVIRGQRLDLAVGNTDQDDRFGMLDQLHARHPGIVVDGHHGVDRLARIAGRADEIRGDEGPADGFAPPEHRRDGQILAHRTIGIGAFDQFGGGHFIEETREMGLLRLKGGRQQQDQHNEDSGEHFHTALMSVSAVPLLDYCQRSHDFSPTRHRPNSERGPGEPRFIA